MSGFRVMRARCATCIFRKDSALAESLPRFIEACKDPRTGALVRHRQCHSTGARGQPAGACCKGFFDAFKGEYWGAQIALRLNAIDWIDP